MEYTVGADETVATAVVRAVCVFEGREPRSMRPLAEVVDPDALNVLFTSRGDGTPRVGGRVAFVYGESHVTIDDGEYVTVEPCSLAPGGRPPEP